MRISSTCRGSRPARAVLWALAPSLFAALVLSVFFFAVGLHLWLPGVWMLCYGQGALATATYAPRPIRTMGILTLAAGGLTLALGPGYAVLLMGLVFGLGHVVVRQARQVVRIHGNMNASLRRVFAGPARFFPVDLAAVGAWALLGTTDGTSGGVRAADESAGRWSGGGGTALAPSMAAGTDGHERADDLPLPLLADEHDLGSAHAGLRAA